MTERIEASYPDRAQEIIATTLDRAPMSLRVNIARISPADYATLLDQAGITAAPAWHPENLVLDSPRPVAELPGYADGLVSVQDSGALFACSLLQDAKQVLDACAAPGGKLFHLAEQLPEAGLTALEKSPARLEHLRSEAARLGHESVVLVQGDATTTDWHEGGPFDAILLDAPCSGSGTLRRHPDIKVLRQASDLPRYAALQRRLLDNLWRLLAPGGTLVYCTCSLFPEENDQVVEGFLGATGDVNLATLSLPIGVPTRHGWQLLPLPDAAVDGFYYARMIRSVEAHPAMPSQRERGQAP
jgi:16S rRNA (cytosine967-C5)-methyltransferase